MEVGLYPGLLCIWTDGKPHEKQTGTGIARLGRSPCYDTVMKNQMGKNVENEVDAGILWWCKGLRLG